MNYEILTGREEFDLVEIEKVKVNKNIISDFLKLKELAKKEINADLQIISGHRNFERQELIWNQKAFGKRSLFDKDGNELDFNLLSNQEILEAILNWSAIPGASRHHWGTDIDIFDANLLTKDKVQLTHAECINGGIFEKLHLWLDEKIQTNSSFGFFRPYNTDKGEDSVAIEKWHLSYAPLSNLYLDNFTLEFFIKNLNQSQMEFKDLLQENVDKYFNYITKVDRSPF